MWAIVWLWLCLRQGVRQSVCGALSTKETTLRRCLRLKQGHNTTLFKTHCVAQCLCVMHIGGHTVVVHEAKSVPLCDGQ